MKWGDVMGKFGVRILWTARYDYVKGERLKLHRHTYYQMIWIADGSGVFHHGDEIYELKPGTLFFIKPNQPHGLSVSNEQSLKTLDIKFHIDSKELARSVDPIPIQVQHPSREIPRLLELIRQEGLIRTIHYLELAELRVVELLYLSSRSLETFTNQRDQSVVEVGLLEQPVSRTNLSPAEKLEQWIMQHADQNWTITEMSKSIGYSPSYLSQLFKQYKGLTITAFLKEVRIHRSKEMLTYSDLSIKQIAEKAGFKTVHHFSRVFKEMEGITPGQWMARENSGIRKDIVFNEGR
jgi:AraC-like DNA-binding protein